MSETTNGEEPDRAELEEKLSKALADVETYKNELATTNSLLEEAEELVEFTWDQVESAQEELEKGLSSSKATIRNIQEVADAAEERAYQAEQELHRLELDGGRQLFDQALELAVRKAKRYDRGLALLVFPRVEEEGEEERLIQVLRDSDFFGRLDETTYAVILEEDLPYHDIGECIERLSARIGLPYASSIFAVDANTADELLETAKQALDKLLG